MLSSHLLFSLRKSASSYNTSSLICLVHWFKCVLPLPECFIPEFCGRRDVGTPPAPAVTTVTIASHSPSVADSHVPHNPDFPACGYFTYDRDSRDALLSSPPTLLVHPPRLYLAVGASTAPTIQTRFTFPSTSAALPY